MTTTPATTIRNAFARATSGVTKARKASKAGLAALVAGTALTAGLGLAATPAAADTGGVSCGSVVRTSVVLQHDLIGCPGDGLVIGASDITIDLGGHLISGPGTGTTTSLGSGHGVAGRGFQRVVVKNGLIGNFQTGVQFLDMSYSHADNLHFGRNLHGVFVTGAMNTVDGNTLSGLSDGTAGMGVLVSGGEGNAVTNNAITGFRFDGIAVGPAAAGTTISGNDVSHSGNGIWFWGRKTYVSGNSVSYNTQWGIVVNGYHCSDSGVCHEGGSGSITGNTATYNTSDGISVDVSSGPVTIGTNVANSNAGRGINGWTSVTDAGRNRAAGNHVNPQCTYVAC